MYAVYVGLGNNNTVCVVADDADIYLSLINISHHIRCHLYFRQGKPKGKDGVNYHDKRAIAVHLGEEICQILPYFHTLAVSSIICYTLHVKFFKFRLCSIRFLT